MKNETTPLVLTVPCITAEPDIHTVIRTPVTPQINSCDVVRLLGSLPVFSTLSAQEREALAVDCCFTSLSTGAYAAIEGGDESRCGFIVASGRLALIKTSLSGKEMVVELLAPGDIFGLLFVLDTESRLTQLSVRAQSPSRILWIPARNVTSLLDAHPLIYKECLKQLLRCLQSSYSHSRGLAHDRVEARMAAALADLAQKFARPLPATRHRTIDITRQQLADLTGTTPETAIRVTRAMQRAGLIDIRRPGIVRILNLPALQALAED